MKYSEEIFLNEVRLLYKEELEVIGRFKGLSKPLLVKDKYGIMQLSKASLLLQFKPGIKVALNKTTYFMNQLKDLYPEIADIITPISEYIKAKDKMLFNTKFGVVTISPDALLSGHCPNIRSAVDRKSYMYNQLKYLYQDYSYDFEILSTNRHEGRCNLVCPIHGKVSIDNDHIFSGCGCPKCNTEWNKANFLYIVKLTSKTESFYKLGISYKKANGDVRRFDDYRKLGYTIEVVKIFNYSSYELCIEKETKLKRLIKNNIYVPKNWPNNGTTECFTQDLLEIIINNI